MQSPVSVPPQSDISISIELASSGTPSHQYIYIGLPYTSVKHFIADVLWDRILLNFDSTNPYIPAPTNLSVCVTRLLITVDVYITASAMPIKMSGRFPILGIG